MMETRTSARVASENKNNNNKALTETKSSPTKEKLTCACGKVFRRKASYDRHCDVAHKATPRHKCEQCGKTFSNLSALTTHQSVHDKVSSNLLNTLSANTEQDTVVEIIEIKSAENNDDVAKGNEKGLSDLVSTVIIEGKRGANDTSLSTLKAGRWTGRSGGRDAGRETVHHTESKLGAIISKSIRQVRTTPSTHYNSKSTTQSHSCSNYVNNTENKQPKIIKLCDKDRNTHTVFRSEVQSSLDVNNETKQTLPTITVIKHAVRQNSDMIENVRPENNNDSIAPQSSSPEVITTSGSKAELVASHPTLAHVKIEPEVSNSLDGVISACALINKKQSMRNDCLSRGFLSHSKIATSSRAVSVKNTTPITTKTHCSNNTPHSVDTTWKTLLTTAQGSKTTRSLQTPVKTPRPVCSTGTNGNSIEQKIELITMYKTDHTSIGTSPVIGLINKSSFPQDGLMDVPIVKPEYVDMDILQTPNYMQSSRAANFTHQQSYFNMDDPVGQSLHEVLPETDNDIAALFPGKYAMKQSTDEAECNFPCYVCGKRFLTEKYLSMHISLHGPTNKDEAFIIAANNSDKSVQETLMEETPLSMPHNKVNKLSPSPPTGNNPSPNVVRIVQKNNASRKKQPDNGWTCKLCTKSFAHNSGFKNHMRTHSNERPYICQVCYIGFKEKYHLKKHNLFIHSTDLPEKCKVCGKRFKDSTAVRAHERIHSDARPFGCRRCGKSFKTSECLWHHEHRSKSCGQMGTMVATGEGTFFAPKGRRKTMPSIERKAYDKENIETKITSITPLGSQFSSVEQLDTTTDSNGNQQLAQQTIHRQKNKRTPVRSPVRVPQQNFAQIKVLKPDNITAVPAAVADMFPEPVAHATLPSSNAHTAASVDNKRYESSPNSHMIPVKNIKQEPEASSSEMSQEVDEMCYEDEEDDFDIANDSEEQVNNICGKDVEDITDRSSQETSPTASPTASPIASPTASPLKKVGSICCKVCSQKFTDQLSYERHMKVHTEPRPFQCELCEYSFKMKVHLKKHYLYVHNNERRCECQYCGKKFKDNSAVKLHERTHSNIRPYKCLSCSKAFKTRENLWGHEHRGTCMKQQSRASSEEYSGDNSWPSAEATVSSNGMTAHASVTNNQVTAQCIRNNQVVARAVIGNKCITAEASVVENGLKAHASIINDNVTAQATAKSDQNTASATCNGTEAKKSPTMFTQPSQMSMATPFQNTVLAPYLVSNNGKMSNVSMLLPQTIYTLAQDGSTVLTLPHSGKDETMTIQQQYQQFHQHQNISSHETRSLQPQPISQPIPQQVSQQALQQISEHMSPLPQQLSTCQNNGTNVQYMNTQQIMQSTTVTKIIENRSVQQSSGREVNNQKLPTLKEFLHKNMDTLKIASAHHNKVTTCQSSATINDPVWSNGMLNGQDMHQGQQHSHQHSHQRIDCKEAVTSDIEHSPNACSNTSSLSPALSNDIIPPTSPIIPIAFGQDHVATMEHTENTITTQVFHDISSSQPQPPSCQKSYQTFLSIPSPILSTSTAVEMPLTTPPLPTQSPHSPTEFSDNMVVPTSLVDLSCTRPTTGYDNSIIPPLTATSAMHQVCLARDSSSPYSDYSSSSSSGTASNTSLSSCAIPSFQSAFLSKRASPLPTPSTMGNGLIRGDEHGLQMDYWDDTAPTWPGHDLSAVDQNIFQDIPDSVLAQL